MGINKADIKLLKGVLPSSWAGLSMCELGNQHVRLHGKRVYTTGKKYFEQFGVEHDSLDINGKDGAIKCDLSEEITGRKGYDVVTDFGTIEHVKEQFWAWSNVHALVKVGGLMVHVLPLAGYWKRHCKYHYTDKFAHMLASDNAYLVEHLSVRAKIASGKRYKSLCFVYRKTEDNEFCGDAIKWIEVS